MRKKIRDTGRFVAPSEMTGEWLDCHGTYFWHEKPPVAVKNVLEKMTGMALSPDPDDKNQLCYGGAVRSGGELQVIWLRLEALFGSRHLYSMIIKSTAPRKWVNRTKFLRMARQNFSNWCSNLKIPSSGIPWDDASTFHRELGAHEQEVGGATAANDLDYERPSPDGTSMGEGFEDPFPAEVFFMTDKESGPILVFDGNRFLENSPHTSPRVAGTLRDFFQWDRRYGIQPHQFSEGDGWAHIVNQLVMRHV